MILNENLASLIYSFLYDLPPSTLAGESNEDLTMDTSTTINGLCRQWDTSKGNRFQTLHVAFDICARIGAIASKAGMTPEEFILTCEKGNPFTYNETALNNARSDATMWKQKYELLQKRLISLIHIGEP